MRIVFRRASTIVASYLELGSLILELWECAHVTSPVAEESLLEISLIKTIFDIPIIRASSGANGALAGILSEVCIRLFQKVLIFWQQLLNLHRLARKLSSYAKERDHSPQLLQTHSDKDTSALQRLSPRVNGLLVYLWILSTLPPAKSQSLLLRLQWRGSLMKFALSRQSISSSTRSDIVLIIGLRVETITNSTTKKRKKWPRSTSLMCCLGLIRIALLSPCLQVV